MQSTNMDMYEKIMNIGSVRCFAICDKIPTVHVDISQRDFSIDDDTGAGVSLYSCNQPLPDAGVWCIHDNGHDA